MAKGYLQVYDLDYYDSVALVAKVVIVRVYLSIATCSKWHVH